MVAPSPESPLMLVVVALILAAWRLALHGLVGV